MLSATSHCIVKMFDPVLQDLTRGSINEVKGVIVFPQNLLPNTITM